MLISIVAWEFTLPAHAGFVSIDQFTDSEQSDGLGVRKFIGDVKVTTYDAASMVSGVAWMGEVSSIVYDFLPAPLVVKPKFVLKLKNNQTTFLESGVLRASINGLPYLERELFADKDDYEIVVFDFTETVPASETIRELRLDWLRPDQATGARELLIDSIEVQDVPEPKSMTLIGSAAGMAALFRRRRKRSD